MELEASTQVACPYCGETFTTFVDLSAGDAEYIEDCQVCCRPINLRIEISDLENGEFEVFADASS